VLNPAPRVVVVGGSLGGLFHAIALRAIGCEVEVFEKSAGLLHDRGALRGWGPDQLDSGRRLREFGKRLGIAPNAGVDSPGASETRGDAGG
jgi:2-polyprenyl-6-methoxyphenol hydroxylase-like FAD-dependent oxidoreductase